MGTTVRQLYRAIDGIREYCFNIESTAPLTVQELSNLKLLLADGFLAETVAETPTLAGKRVVNWGRGSISPQPGLRTWFPSAGPSALIRSPGWSVPVAFWWMRVMISPPLSRPTTTE